MVSRTETARALLTPGEVMQLPPDDEIVMVAGVPPIRAQKVRYYVDRRLTARVLDPPVPAPSGTDRAYDWSNLPVPACGGPATEFSAGADDAANGGIGREPELPEEQDILPRSAPPAGEFEFDDNAGEDAASARRLNERMKDTARQASLDPRDGIEL